jgi:hypothetical protein
MNKKIFPLLLLLPVVFLLGRLSAQEDVQPSCLMCAAEYLSLEEISKYMQVGRDKGITDQQLRSIDVGRAKVQIAAAHRGQIEQRIGRAEDENAAQPDVLAGFEKPEGVPDSYEEHIRLMGDMMILAFQTDVTRVSTFMLANAGSNRSYRPIGVSEGHHSLSHHQNNSDKLEKISKINTFHVEQLAYMLQKMKSIPEGDGSLLDNCMIVYGSGISDGNRHNNENLPIVLAGRGGGWIRPGRHIQYSGDTPLNNLFVTMLNQAGATTGSFNDSTGTLPFLS